MVVAKTERGQGTASNVLRYLINNAKQRELKPICSTEYDNIGAQKSIARAGLICVNRIIQIDFNQR